MLARARSALLGAAILLFVTALMVSIAWGPIPTTGWSQSPILAKPHENGLELTAVSRCRLDGSDT